MRDAAQGLPAAPGGHGEGHGSRRERWPKSCWRSSNRAFWHSLPAGFLRIKAPAFWHSLPAGFLRIKAPKKAVGELDTTFLDNELRIGRGDKGNLFVLFKDDVFTPAAA